MSTVQIDVPKNHPGLPRLVAAAQRLPSIEFVKQDGVAVRKKQFLTREALEEFFAALRDITGNGFAEEIEQRLGLKKTLELGDEQGFSGLLESLSGKLPLGMLQSMVAGKLRR